MGPFPDAAGCLPTAILGALPLCDRYFVKATIGNGGFAYPYFDPAGSTGCMLQNALCGAGTTVVASTTAYGAGLGVNLNQPDLPDGGVSPFALTGSGIKYAITATTMPAELRLSVFTASGGYCVGLTSTSGTVPWSSFNSQCWSGAGTTLTLPYSPTGVEFVVPALSAPGSYDFCVTTLEIVP
jgi:hypothetical protein